MKNPQLYMERCLQLAQLGLGYVSPNPIVGAVLVHDYRIIGEGYHQKLGGAHAEVNCINSVSPEDKALIPLSTLFVSLEPCSHFGKTPPCTDYILMHGIRQVVIACSDSSAKVNGKGIQILRDAGVEVIEHVLEEEAQWLNRRFFTNCALQRPHIVIKWAETADGFIGSQLQRTKISSIHTDPMVHQWRSQEDAIWVGYQTALVDNPRLNVRFAIGKNPIRIVFDRDCTLPPSLHLFDQTQDTIVFNTIKSTSKPNLTYLKIDPENYVQQIIDNLESFDISSILVEGGTQLITKLFDMNAWDEARIIHSPMTLDQGIQAPQLPSQHQMIEAYTSSPDRISIYKNLDR